MKDLSFYIILYHPTNIAYRRLLKQETIKISLLLVSSVRQGTLNKRTLPGSVNTLPKNSFLNFVRIKYEKVSRTVLLTHYSTLSYL